MSSRGFQGSGVAPSRQVLARVHCLARLQMGPSKIVGIWQNRKTSFHNPEKTMDRLEAMSIALAVAEAGSLTAAARRKKTPLATVSRKVSELEAHLQTKLFNRTNRALVLTDAGRSFVVAAKRILADVD